MQRISFLFPAILIISVAFLACGHLVDNTPLGVTAGGENGYGSLGGSIGSGGGGGGVDNALLGTWRYDITAHDYEILIVNANHTFEIQVYQSDTLIYTYSGTYSASNGILTITYGSESETWSYSISGNTLTVVTPDGTMVFHRG
jgi:hypothetical protein